jgi:hypothetical protein
MVSATKKGPVPCGTGPFFLLHSLPQVVEPVVDPAVEPVVAPPEVVPAVLVPPVLPEVVPEVELPEVPEVEPLVEPEVEPEVDPAFSEVEQAVKMVSDEHSRAPVSTESILRFIRELESGKEGK